MNYQLFAKFQAHHVIFRILLFIPLLGSKILRTLFSIYVLPFERETKFHTHIKRIGTFF
jgi:hypothetical protein